MVAMDKTSYVAFRLKSHCFRRHVLTASWYSTSMPRIIEDGIQNDDSIHPKQKKQLDLFSSYKSRLFAARIPRVEKIEVNFVPSGIGDGATMMMNKGLSTPYNCAQHISKNHTRNSVIALVKELANTAQGEVTILNSSNPNEKAIQDSNETISDAAQKDSAWLPWDMHRPLEYNCDLKFLTFNMELATSEEMALVNAAYWKTCSLLLGAVAKQAFKADANVRLVHLPQVDIKSGAFCYDVEILDDVIKSDNKTKWHDNEQSLVHLTKVVRHIISQNHTFERIELPREDAAAIFSEDYHIQDRLHKSFSTVNNESDVPIYRFGNFLDVVDGPLLPSTAFMFHYVVTAVHRLGRTNSRSCLWRLQGVSLPKALQVHHAIWAMLERRAKRLVRKDLPTNMSEQEEFEVPVPIHKYRSIENKTKRYNIATGQWLEDGWLKKSNEKS